MDMSANKDLKGLLCVDYQDAVLQSKAYVDLTKDVPKNGSEKAMRGHFKQNSVTEV
jgi:hypothetical protein